MDIWKFGVQTSHSQEDVSMMQEMMTPKSQLTIDGQTVYFFKLWEKYLDSLESGELPERTPSEHDLDILSGIWMKTRPEVTIDQGENEMLKVL